MSRRRQQLAGACGDITGPGRPSRGPRAAPPPPAPPPSPAAFRARGPAEAAAPSSRGRRGARTRGRRAGLGARAGVAEEPAVAARRARTNAAEAPAKLGARSRHCVGGPSDEDGGPLDAVLLQQLLPVLPCPHRHHPARRLVPGERGGPWRAPGRTCQGGGRAPRTSPGPRPGPPPRFSRPLVRLRGWVMPALIRLKLYY